MTAQTASSQAQSQAQVAQSQEAKSNDKELNFRALEAKYQRELAQERQARLEAESKAQQALKQQQKQIPDDDEDDDPYTTKRALKRSLNQYGEQIKQETQSEIQKAVQQALHEERKANWLKQNSDFYDIMQHAEKFAQQDPELAETILQMPDNFERQKLVYKTIKGMGIHKPPETKSTVQDKINANQRSPYYQPASMGSPPYNATGGDFSPAGQKNAYDKLQQLKARLGSR